MESRVALIGIIVENRNSAENLNNLLHQYSEFIIGRMGLPYPKRGISIISICMDAPADVISALSGKLGMLPGVNIKTVYSKAVAASGEVSAMNDGASPPLLKRRVTDLNVKGDAK